MCLETFRGLHIDHSQSLIPRRAIHKEGLDDYLRPPRNRCFFVSQELSFEIHSQRLRPSLHFVSLAEMMTLRCRVEGWTYIALSSCSSVDPSRIVQQESVQNRRVLYPGTHHHQCLDYIHRDKSHHIVFHEILLAHDHDIHRQCWPDRKFRSSS